MRKFSRDQRIVTAEFLGNFAVAWLAAGLIVPVLQGDFSQEKLLGITMATSWSLALLIYMVYFVGEK